MSKKSHSTSRNRRNPRGHVENVGDDTNTEHTAVSNGMTTASTPATTSTATVSLLETLTVAENKARNALRGTAQLHQWWRQHLYRLSCLVILLCFFQLRKPSEECILNIKLLNQSQSDLILSGWDATRMIVKDSVIEVIGLVMLVALTVFLGSDQPISFSDRHYMIATAMVPMQLSNYVSSFHFLGGDDSILQQPHHQRFVGCIPYLMEPPYQDAWESVMEEKDPSSFVERTFPVSLVFHTVVTMCCLFMKYQSNQRNQEMKQILELKATLESAILKNSKVPPMTKTSKEKSTNIKES